MDVSDDQPLLTAAALLLGGLWLITAGQEGLALVGLGMLLYTVVVSPGYFMARHEVAPAAMFAVLTVMTLCAVTLLLATVSTRR